MTNIGARFASFREPAAVLAVYAALTPWWVWPLPAVLATHLVAPHSVLDFRPDLRLSVWALAWDAHALVTQPTQLFHANAFYPAPLSLAFAEHFLGYVPFFAPVYWLTDNPLLALGVTALLTFPLCAIAAYLLARRFVGGPAAALAGFFFAFSPGRLVLLGEPQLLGCQYLAFAMLLTECWFDRAPPWVVALLALALVLQALSSVYLAFALALAYGVYLPLAVWRWRSRIDARRCMGLLLAIGAAGVIVVAVNLPYFMLRRMGLFPSYGEGEPLHVGLVFARGLTHKFLVNESVGPLGYALAAAALLPPWRRGSGLRPLGLALALVGVVASFGPHLAIAGHSLPTPYSTLTRWVPGFQTIRLPVRFLVVTQLGLALLAGMGAHWLTGGRHSLLAWLAAGLTVMLAIAAMGKLPALDVYPEPVGPSVPATYRWLAAHADGRALLELPMGGGLESAQRMYLSTFHWHPIVDGYSGYPSKTPEYIHELARGLPAEDALQTLVDAVDIGWVLVHRDQLSDPRVWQQALPAGLERVRESGDDLLLQVTRPVAHDVRSRLLSTTETLDGVPLVPLGARCPGALRLAGVPPQPWSPHARIQVVVENHGTQPWPARGLVPRHLVRLRACVARPGTPCLGASQSLPGDVLPGERVTASVELTAPWVAGNYEIDVRLVQLGDGELERCGVPPLRLPWRVGVASANVGQ